MKLVEENDELVKSVTLYNNKSTFSHGYCRPFIILYAVWIAVWFGFNDFSNFLELGLIGIAAIAVLQLLCGLCCFWSIDIRCLLLYKKNTDVYTAEFAKVVPMPNNGSTELVPIYRFTEKSKMTIYMNFQSIKYIFDEDRKVFKSLKFPMDYPLNFYSSCKGFNDDNALKQAQQLFDRNLQTMFIPTTLQLFTERATAPFFVFQIFCSILWMFDSFFYFTLLTIFMLVIFEFTVVKQQIRNMSDILKMGNKPYNINVLRNRRWKSLSTTDLLPGDIVSISRSDKDNMVPCDLLLLKGSCIVDESLLTGESVPQMKESIEEVDDQSSLLNFETHSKIHVVFCGTKVVQTTNNKHIAGLKSPDNGCIGYVLRTGFYTTQGKLLRTILYGVKRVTANNWESFCFILFLLVFAIAAAAYVWIKGSADPNTNKYKLLLECTLIITSTIPPELPIELTLAVNSSLLTLARLGITCTEPFRIPFAGKVDICCFDKTGTLTSDDLIVEGVAGLENKSTEIIPIENIPIETSQVLGTCHSLAILDGKVIGDPLEKTILSSLKWDLVNSDTVRPNKAKVATLRIAHRFHFTSSMKRMTVIASYQTAMSNDYNFIVTVKGAAEVLKPMFVNLPDNYDKIFMHLSRRGARVLALGFKSLGRKNQSDIKELISNRTNLESDLKFVGFVIISCPLKVDSSSVIQEVIMSSHQVTMITGDNALTACHVAKELRFSRKPLIILTQKFNEWVWESSDESVSLSLKETYRNKFYLKYDLCLTGKALMYLKSEHLDFLKSILPFVTVFARCAPKQKEFIIVTLKSLGFITLMCGDGTNDVGALKHAHVGTAILTNNPNLKVKPVKENQFGELDVIQLGDASIAAPFSSKKSTIKCVPHIIKQGRCTLVTTLQMFKILALNALINAYSNSVLFLDGIKLNDTQATVQAFILAICLLCVSKSKPLKWLSKQRPLPTIFNCYTISTVVLQFMNHFISLVYLVSEASSRSPLKEPIVKNVTSSIVNSTLDMTVDENSAEFEPNIINSTVYVISMMLQVSTLAVNYRGHPYMESMRENAILMYTLLCAALSVFAVVSGLVPDLSQTLGIIEFPSDFQMILICVLIQNYVTSLLIDRICLWLFGEGKLKIVK